MISWKTTKAVTKMYTCILYMYTLYRDNLRSLPPKYYIFVFESKVIIIIFIIIIITVIIP